MSPQPSGEYFHQELGRLCESLDAGSSDELSNLWSFCLEDSGRISRIEDFNLIKLLVNMTEVDPGSLAPWC